jgi:predicted DCC family thiol-disulfide oxidoreductase YuxK
MPTSHDPTAPELTILYDGGCPLCRREVCFLAERDRRRHPQRPRLSFVDVDRADYEPARHGGIGYREAMGRIHAIDSEARVLRDLEVFRRAYALIGLGWIYAPSRWPLLASLADAAYRLWAMLRLPLTGRPSLDRLCSGRGCDLSSSDVDSGGSPAAPPAGTS